MFSSYISKEIGFILSEYQSSQFEYFKKQYYEKLEQELKDLDNARQKFYNFVQEDANYKQLINNYIQNQNISKDVTTQFYKERNEYLNKIMNDKKNIYAKKLWEKMESAEQTIFDIRDMVYGGKSQTKYHIGIQVGDDINGRLKSYELDPKQMLKLQSNQNIFKADIKAKNIKGKSIEEFDFSLRFTTKDDLTANQLISGIEQVDGTQYHQATIGSFFNVYDSVQGELLRLQEEQISIKLKGLEEKLTALTQKRIDIGNRYDQYSKQLTQQMIPIRKQIKKLKENPEQVLNFGYGRGFEAYERKMYGMSYLPSQNANLTYNDNTSWVMQQDVNFIDQTDTAKLMMIQNKFFKEKSRFSTISMSSLFSALESFKYYFTIPKEQWEIDYEMSNTDRKRLDDVIYATAASAAKESLSKNKGLDYGGKIKDIL